MAFTKQTWTEDVTPTSAANMQRFEDALDDLYNKGIRKAAGTFRAAHAGSTSLGSGGVGGKFTYTAGEELIDVSSWFDPTTGRFTPQFACICLLTVRVLTAQVLAVGTNLEARVVKNGVTATFEAQNRNQAANSTSGVFVELNERVSFNGTTDYVESWGWHDYGSARTVSASFSGQVIGTP
jgi:hypothetical protein